MSSHTAPNDVRGFSITAFLAFVIVFVFAMMMMLWHGNYSRDANGQIHYDTHVSSPTDGNPDDE